MNAILQKNHKLKLIVRYAIALKRINIPTWDPVHYEFSTDGKLTEKNHQTCFVIHQSNYIRRSAWSNVGDSEQKLGFQKAFKKINTYAIIRMMLSKDL